MPTSDWETRYAMRKAKKEASRKERERITKENRIKTLNETRSLMKQLILFVKETSFNRDTRAKYSGVSPAVISRILRGHYKTARFSTIVGLARMAGYKIQFVRRSPEEDDFFDERWVKLSQMYQTKDKK